MSEFSVSHFLQSPGIIRFLLKQILLYIIRGEYDTEKVILFPSYIIGGMLLKDISLIQILLLASEAVDGLSDIKVSMRYFCRCLHFANFLYIV